ncbi:MAG: hypothetical protein R3E66_22530 [bacterium]
MKWLVCTVLSLLGTNVVAQDLSNAPTAAVERTMMDSGDYRSKTQDWLIAPGGSGSVGGGFTFMTADGDLGGVLGTRRLKFTDVVLLGLQSRYSLGGIAEVSLATSLLPKQPSTTDELAWQSASLGFRIGLTDHLLTALSFAGGPTLDQSGGWTSAQLGLGWRYAVNPYMVFDGGVHGRGTALFIEDEAPWFGEVATNVQLVLPNPGIAAFWCGVEFTFPVASNATTSLPIDPQTRANVMVGGVLSFVDDWDIYATYAFIDRGDLVDPATTLPILDGGFDQQQLTVGVAYRFEGSTKTASR